MKVSRIYSALFSITVLLLFVSVGFNIHHHKKRTGSSEINKLAENHVTKKTPVKDPAPAPAEDMGEDSGKNEINKLEYQLNAAEEEVDIVTEQLNEELTKKEEYKKAIENLNLSDMKDGIAFTAKKQADSYNPLFKKLNMSKEEFEEFKNLIAERKAYTDGYYNNSQVTLKSMREASTYYKKKIVNF